MLVRYRPLFALAGIVMMFGGSARAETISYADAMSVLSRDCGADITKLCSGLNIGNGRIADCLHTNATKVSPVCVSTLATVTTSIKQRQEAQAAYYQVCKQKMATTCSGKKGDGNMLSCLVKASRVVGDKCNQAITDAGWR